MGSAVPRRRADRGLKDRGLRLEQPQQAHRLRERLVPVRRHLERQVLPNRLRAADRLPELSQLPEPPDLALLQPAPQQHREEEHLECEEHLLPACPDRLHRACSSLQGSL